MTFLVERDAFQMTYCENRADLNVALVEKDDEKIKAFFNRILQSLLDSQPKPAGRFLNQFVTVSPNEEITLSLMLRKCVASGSLIFLTVFGMMLHGQIKEIKKLLPQADFKPVENLFYTVLFSIYQSFGMDEEAPDFPDKYIDTRTKVPIHLKEVCKILLTILDSEKKRRTARAAVQLPDLKITKYKAGLELQAGKNITKFQENVDLFLKIFTSDRKGELLLGSHFQITSVPLLISSHNVGDGLDSLFLRDLENYAGFCAAMLKGVFDSRASIFTVASDFETLEKLLHSMRNKVIDQQDIFRLKMHLFEKSKFFANQILYLRQESRLAKEGKLDFESWKKNRGMKSKNKKNQTEFMKYLSASNSQAKILDFFFSQFEILFDSHVISPEFPHFSSLAETRGRLLKCLEVLPDTIPDHTMILPPKHFPFDFNTFFCDLLSPIDQECQFLLQFVNRLRDEKELDYLENTKTGSQTAGWLHVLVPLKNSNQVLALLKSQIDKLTLDLMVKLRTEIEHLPPNLSQEEVEEIIEYINKVTFDQSLFLGHCTIILEEIDTIVNGRFSLTCKYVSPSVVNLVELVGVNDLIHTLLRPRVPAAFEPISQPLVESPAEEPVEDREDSPLKPDVKPFVVQKQSPLENRGAPELSPDFLQLKKIRFIAARLEEALFSKVRTKGSHSIWKRDEVVVEEDGSERLYRRTVVVPEHPTLPRGTVGSIYKQANDPLQRRKGNEEKKD